MRYDMQIRRQHNEISCIFNLVLMNVRADNNELCARVASRKASITENSRVVPYHRNAFISSLSLSKLSTTILVK